MNLLGHHGGSSWSCLHDPSNLEGGWGASPLWATVTPGPSAASTACWGRVTHNGATEGCDLVTLETLLFLWALLPPQGSPQKGTYESPPLPDPTSKVEDNLSPGPSQDTVLSTSLAWTLRNPLPPSGSILLVEVVLTQDAFP